MTSNGAQPAVVAFHGQPPDTGRDGKPRLPIAKRFPDDGPAIRSRSAVERGPKPRRRIRSSSGPVGRIPAELSVKRSGPAPRAIECLTSAPGDRDAGHERVEAPRVLGRAPIGADHLLRLAVERIAPGAECRVK